MSTPTTPCAICQGRGLIWLHCEPVACPGCEGDSAASSVRTPEPGFNSAEDAQTDPRLEANFGPAARAYLEAGETVLRIVSKKMTEAQLFALRVEILCEATLINVALVQVRRLRECGYVR